MKLGAALVALAISTTPVLAQSTDTKKAELCRHTANVVRTIQNMRIDRVKRADVEAKVIAQENPWPDVYNNQVPLLVPWVYDNPRENLKIDLGAQIEEQCLAN
ncbi:MAG: hypothetical protein WBC93_05690 [Sulfitobacter sp.]